MRIHTYTYECAYEVVGVWRSYNSSKRVDRATDQRHYVCIFFSWQSRLIRRNVLKTTSREYLTFYINEIKKRIGESCPRAPKTSLRTSPPPGTCTQTLSQIVQLSANSYCRRTTVCGFVNDIEEDQHKTNPSQYAEEIMLFYPSSDTSKVDQKNQHKRDQDGNL